MLAPSFGASSRPPFLGRNIPEFSDLEPLEDSGASLRAASSLPRSCAWGPATAPANPTRLGSLAAGNARPVDFEAQGALASSTPTQEPQWDYSPLTANPKRTAAGASVIERARTTTSILPSTQPATTPARAPLPTTAAPRIAAPASIPAAARMVAAAEAGTSSIGAPRARSRSYGTGPNLEIGRAALRHGGLGSQSLGPIRRGKTVRPSIPSPAGNVHTGSRPPHPAQIVGYAKTVMSSVAAIRTAWAGGSILSMPGLVGSADRYPTGGYPGHPLGGAEVQAQRTRASRVQPQGPGRRRIRSLLRARPSILPSAGQRALLKRGSLTPRGAMRLEGGRPLGQINFSGSKKLNNWIRFAFGSPGAKTRLGAGSGQGSPTSNNSIAGRKGKEFPGATQKNFSIGETPTFTNFCNSQR